MVLAVCFLIIGARPGAILQGGSAKLFSVIACVADHNNKRISDRHRKIVKQELPPGTVTWVLFGRRSRVKLQKIQDDDGTGGNDSLEGSHHKGNWLREIQD
jgi:hypothetical protein